MPFMPKQNLLAFAKKKAAPPPAATVLAQKRAQAKAPPPAGNPTGDHAADELPGEENEVNLFELVEEAAEAAEAGGDTELEDIIAGTQSTGPEDVPAWAEDPEKWKEAAEAVGLGVPGTEDKYAEPHVVAAYLYKMIAGPVKGLEIPAPPAVPEGPGESDMTKPGAAAKAMQAKMAAKGAAPSPEKKAPPAKALEGGGGAGDDLKKMLDDAAADAKANPDPRMAGYDPVAHGNPPAWVADEDKWDKAKQAVDPEGEGAQYDEPWAVVASVYKKMGGSEK